MSSTNQAKEDIMKNSLNRKNDITYKKTVKKSRVFGELAGNKVLYIMTLPGIIYLLLFAYLPMVGIYMAFTDYNVVDGIFGSKFAGFENFKFFLTGGDSAIHATTNTLILNTLFIFTSLIFQVSIALLINEIKSKMYKKITQSMLFLPYFLSWIVVGSIVYSLFASEVGTVNTILRSLGIEPISWYAESGYWKAILTGVNIWKWTGYGSIIYLASMASFDVSYYEASIVDGASRFQQLKYITLPLLKPTAIVLTLFSIGRMFYGDFGMVYGIIGENGTLYRTTEVIDVYVFRAMRSLGSFSHATAIGLMQSVLGFILIVFSNKAAKKINDGDGLF
jgi:putative aldouronate transport system permease protein